MRHLRPDIAEAAERMRVTFGARSAIRDLGDALVEDEIVLELAACQFAGSHGVLVLTDERVLAVRDDYSRYVVKACLLSELTAVDYAPDLHDGFAAVSPEAKVAVRRMDRQDSDRLVEALRAAARRPARVDRPAAGASPRPTRNVEHEALVDVLTELHVRGLLTAEELAVKIAALPA